MKFIKTQWITKKMFISDCGMYKVVNYGGKIYAYHRMNFKLKEPFGDSIYHDTMQNSIFYKSYREAFSEVEKFEQKRRIYEISRANASKTQRKD